MPESVSLELGGRTFTIEVGKVAKQASGSAWIRYGDTVVLTALLAITGIGNGALVGAFAQGQALDSYTKALVVHHGEHRVEALVRLADQIADCAVEVHHTGG